MPSLIIFINLIFPIFGLEAILLPHSFQKYRYNATYNSHFMGPTAADSQGAWATPAFHFYYKTYNAGINCTLDISDDVLCVECDAFTRAKSRRNRCRGSGRFMRKTGYHVLGHACHGRWLKLTRRLPGACTDSTSGFIFV